MTSLSAKHFQAWAIIQLVCMCVRSSLVPRPPLAAFFTAVENARFSMAVKKAARGGLGTRLCEQCTQSYGLFKLLCVVDELLQNNSRLFPAKRLQLIQPGLRGKVMRLRVLSRKESSPSLCPQEVALPMGGAQRSGEKKKKILQIPQWTYTQCKYGDCE